MPTFLPRAFVIGDPIAHSRSPRVHGYWLKQYGLEGSYEAVHVTPEALPAFMRDLRANGWIGGNVTIPYKEAVIPYVQRLTLRASRLKSVNTLWFEGDVLCGDSTDGEGFWQNVCQTLDTPFHPKSAVILGAGGSARSILATLIEESVERITVVNRTYARAQALAEEWADRAAVSAYPWENLESVFENTDLLVQTTAQSMTGETGLPIPLEALPSRAVVADIVYVPLQTEVLRQAEALGLRTVQGLGMLLHQAVPGFERWFGQRPTVTQELYAMIVT
jgi:shikimate dehydrogenase